MADWATPTAVYDKCGEEATHLAVYAIDGNSTSYWRHSAVSENHWLEFDLGDSYTVTKIQVFQSTVESYRFGYDGGVDAYVSNDPESWGAAVWTGSLHGASGWVASGAFEKVGRYVRIYSKTASAGQRLVEIQAEVAAVVGGMKTRVMII
jgi:hypothetical protein